MHRRYRCLPTLRRQHGNFNGLMSLFAAKKPANNTPTPDDPTKGGTVDPKTGLPVNKQNNNPLEDIDPATGKPRQSQDNPLDNFKDLFNNANKGDDAPPSFSLDPAKLKGIVDQLNFTGQMSSEDLEGLKSGDPEKVNAILNGVGRNAYATLMQHIPALTEHYVSARMEHANKGLGSQVKQTLTQQALDKLASKNPVLKQQMEAIGNQLLAKFPDATPDWIAEQTQSYFVSVAKLLKPDAFRNEDDLPNPQRKDARDLSTQEGFSWDGYLGAEASKTQK